MESDMRLLLWPRSLGAWSRINLKKMCRQGQLRGFTSLLGSHTAGIVEEQLPSPQLVAFHGATLGA